ncbi:MAG TPA: phosphoenolpyruvate--protein phosphotransferase [Dongiaceae bacterium]|jgi:phosphotransferase system enzyme I (PtsI)|nr:phosphoenolpyruvate--protein phosphotransferase [Dongiaceae bacterium]
MAELRLTGRPASPGLALSRLFVLGDDAARTGTRPAGDPDQEAVRLRAAIEAAIQQLEEVSGTTAADAQEILEFQVAMLGDEALAEGAFAAIAGGENADAAWRAALNVQLEDYVNAGDEYFRARAADLEDLRDRVSGILSGGEQQSVPAGTVLVARDLPPSRFLGIDWQLGSAIALAGGSPTSHVALLARARGVPMIVGLGADVMTVPSGLEAMVDGERGTLVVAPDDATRASAKSREMEINQRRAIAEKFQHARATLPSGEPVTIMINTAGPDELSLLDPAICDGIGLVRSEFLFHGATLPDEETQYQAYRRILRWAGARPVTIRTLDAGGDKPIPGLTIDDEGNPFLGTRGIRLSLQKPDVFRVQLRALCRAALHGNLKVMLPMVAMPRDLAQGRAHLDAVVSDLAAQKVPYAVPPLGIMVEVPAAAIAIDRFDADFYSIGSNDLTQYVMAAARDIASLSDYANPIDPAVLSLITRTVEHGKRTGREVSLCGDAASDPTIVPHLLAAGLRSLSVSASSVGLVKAAIAGALVG